MAGDMFGVILDGKRGDEDDYFKILGCSESSTEEQITAEYRVRALQCHPDKHPGDVKALGRFQKLQEARDILLDSEKRQKYDRWRQSEMCIPYKQWLSMSNRCATTMHWAKPRDQTMLESPSQHKRAELEEHLKTTRRQPTSSTPAEVKWNSGSEPRQNVWKPDGTTEHSIYAKFRNYKI